MHKFYTPKAVRIITTGNTFIKYVAFFTSPSLLGDVKRKADVRYGRQRGSRRQNVMCFKTYY